MNKDNKAEKLKWEDRFDEERKQWGFLEETGDGCGYYDYDWDKVKAFIAKEISQAEKQGREELAEDIKYKAINKDHFGLHYLMLSPELLEELTNKDNE